VYIQILTNVLVLQVSLLVAFTALVINAEVEVTPDQENGVASGMQHSGDNGDNGDKQAHGHKKDRSKDQKNILKKILDYLAMDIFVSVICDFTFDGQRIPIDFIMTAVYIDSKHISSVTVEDLWEIIQL
jgi:hypothetical protein